MFFCLLFGFTLWEDFFLIFFLIECSEGKYKKQLRSNYSNPQKNIHTIFSYTVMSSFQILQIMGLNHSGTGVQKTVINISCQVLEVLQQYLSVFVNSSKKMLSCKKVLLEERLIGFLTIGSKAQRTQFKENPFSKIQREQTIQSVVIH